MSSKPTVLLLRNDYPQKAVDLLRTRCNVEMCKSSKKDGRIIAEDVLECVQGKFSIFCHNSRILINEQVLKAAGPSLKVIGTMSVGYDHIDLTSMKKYGVRLGNTPGILTESVAEIAVGLIIATTRRFSEANRELKTGGWKEWIPGRMCGRSIKGSVVGILGCGRIGTSIAEKLVNFKVSQLLYTSRNEKPDVKALGGQLVTVDELMERSDFVVVAAALNDETKFIVNRERIATMKSNAILVNISRGQLIDQDALVEALKEKRIRGAGLDVMTPEPLPLDHPLIGLDNVLLLPHIGTSTLELEEEMAVMTAQNILAVLDGCPMPNEVVF
ncbi:glyoxylate reductase/hydroxypyruvate reductase-like isoform X1 [Rhopalosiphum maidis]|uniref:glyoxylate reductase/hydroxypyruvate reductase-like isoform X1 n=1 Tax=Rhopalosiphum maidis TaxID=43146 RepID=UPI000EFE324E|nr:glyoxylate reductase/hydroxypyruvate reductase-like isoform X1 [Rhopalosiphum maidis]XP_026816285.1 glyoxylate reductase/hydroxypyruvate reductase-like isoform X1 [Rhopalosiphum maidis]XP_026816286.1 glyoxylate reductase/hydroxypyruvate reductase-like isoform X1 [Rhopalosiphum maidis]XP_026816287.1 glyoxylate reductase/hydroxypyruvate reductase-like isoform X1 [Rhopalosiphum maidis]XP_026816289.1 glyoxylate reductase/hydroxypyruvate reductase-like isoform X1 [Rhopalosiphum maidis]XP_0268162